MNEEADSRYLIRPDSDLLHISSLTTTDASCIFSISCVLEFVCAFNLFSCLWNWLQGSNQWADQYAMSVEGSPLYYDNDNGVTAESDGDPMDEEAPILCTGLDHADSQGLNKTNLRLR